MSTETIAALATPPGVGAVSVIRVSGDAALEVIAACFSRSEALYSTPRRAVLGSITGEDSVPIDEVLATAYPAPGSYTGESVVEISGHGGLFVTQRVLARILSCGARPAQPGEFTQRAFLNGKMDLTQAEGVMDIISAQSDLALRAAQNQLHGSILRRTGEIREELIAVTAHLEAHIDFPEEDIDPESGDLLRSRLTAVRGKCEALLATSETGKLLREGARLVICGQPNAGKSSLLNALLGYERAIVSEVMGTTRDTVEEIMNFAGVPVRLIDTAGLRETAEAVERAGIERTKGQLEGADLIIELIDGSQPKDAWEPAELPLGIASLRLLNKSDLGIDASWSEDEMTLSCVDQKGVEGLKARVAAELLGGQALTGSAFVAINARHQSCLMQVQAATTESIDALCAQTDPELVAVTLREALQAVGELTGRVDTEEILGVIFAQFCIGK